MAILACVALSAIAPVFQPVRAAGPWYVAPGGNDANTCTAPGAPCATINAALNKPGFVAGDTIRVAAGTYTGAGEQVVLLDKSATLSGGWNPGFTAQSGMSTIDGQGARRGINIESGTVVTIERFVVQNGATDDGGGIRVVLSSLTLNNSTVSGNSASGAGAGIFYFGNGGVILNNSAVSENEGIGIANYSGAVTLNNSTVSGNTGVGSAGIRNDNGGVVTLNNSTVSGNGGGGIRNLNGSVTLNNSTISGNRNPGVGGGILNEYLGTLTLNSSTVSGNTSDDAGGGIASGDWPGAVTLRNSILSDNTADSYPDCAGLIGSAGYNLIGNTSDCTFSTNTGDLTNVDPRLGPLEGSPGYQPLLPGSLAVNAGNPDGCKDDKGNLLPTDQRGLPRFGRCDIGAYELQPLGFSTMTVNRSIVVRGDPLTYTITLKNPGATAITNARVTNTLPVSLSYTNNSLTATSGSVGYQNGVITWTGTVNAGGTVTIAYGATVNSARGRIANSAVISGGGESITRTATVTLDGPICKLTKQAGNPVLPLGTSGSWDDATVWDPAVLKEESSYKMWYSGADGSAPSRIGLATSVNGTTWTKAAANPVLSPSEWWETKGIRAGSIIFENSLYKMWYSGRDSNGISRIGYATSPDGVAWTKYGGNPVVSNGNAGSWENAGVSEPTVIKDGSTYHLWYTGHEGRTQRIGHATSGDGIAWTRDPANPILDIGTPGAWDWLNVYGPSVVKVGAGFKLWYSGETLPAAWQTGYALSPNGSAWTRGAMLIPEGSWDAFDAASADYPSVLVDGEKYRVWYAGQNSTGDYTIGYATAEICGGAGGLSGHTVYLPLVMKSPQTSCAAYYTDNFSDPASGWPVGDDDNRTYAYADGQYQILVKTPSVVWWATPGAKATDFTASVSAHRTSGAWGAYGILIGINEDWSQLYQFIVEDTYFSIWKYDNGSWTALQDWTASGHINAGTAWNRLKAVRNGASIAVYANNQLLATVNDSSFTGLRRIGLVAQSADDSGLDARFDDFALYPASCGAGAASAAGVGFEMGEPGGYGAPAPPRLDRMR